MPIYVYRCPTCGDSFEEKRPIANRDDPWCCGALVSHLGSSVLMQRVPTAATFRMPTPITPTEPLPHTRHLR